MKGFLLILFLAMPMLNYAQSNFRKGYVLAGSKDTLRGYLDYKESKNNPVAVVFKKELDASVQTYTAENCEGYGIYDMVAYRSHLVNISLGVEDFNKLSEVVDTSSLRKRVFLEVIQVGKHVSFFSYTDKIKARYYIQENGTQEPQELIRQLYLKPGASESVLTNSRYIRQLLPLLRKYDKATEAVEYRLSKSNYTRDDLLKMVVLINGEKVQKSKFSKSRFFAGAGVSASSLSFSGSHILTNSKADSKLSFGPVVGGGIDLFVNPAIRKLLFRGELSLAMGNNKISNNSLSYSFDQKSLMITPQIIYHVYNTEAFKVFIGGGIGLSFSKYSNHDVVRRYKDFYTKEDKTAINDPNDVLKFETFYFSFPVSTGVVLNKKLEFSIAYSLPTGITDYVNFNAQKQGFRFGINYLFGKH